MFEGPPLSPENDAPKMPEVDYYVGTLPDDYESAIENLCKQMIANPTNNYQTKIAHIVNQLEGNPAQDGVQRHLNDMHEYSIRNAKYITSE